VVQNKKKRKKKKNNNFKFFFQNLPLFYKNSGGFKNLSLVYKNRNFYFKIFNPKAQCIFRLDLKRN